MVHNSIHTPKDSVLETLNMQSPEVLLADSSQLSSFSGISIHCNERELLLSSSYLFPKDRQLLMIDEGVTKACCRVSRGTGWGLHSNWVTNPSAQYRVLSFLPHVFKHHHTPLALKSLSKSISCLAEVFSQQPLRMSSSSSTVVAYSVYFTQQPDGFSTISQTKSLHCIVPVC